MHGPLNMKYKELSISCIIQDTQKACKNCEVLEFNLVVRTVNVRFRRANPLRQNVNCLFKDSVRIEQ